MDKNSNWREEWNPRMSMSFTSTKGLLNAPGENNCFLNSAVQVLWHLDVFRRSFRMLSGHACMGNSCIFCALKVIFTQFQYSDQSSLPPDALRKALARCFQGQQRFQMGLMDDAAECFENILMRIHFHIANDHSEDACNARHCIPHQKFSMAVIEQVVCQCGATSEPLPFTQMVHYVTASALVAQGKSLGRPSSGIPFGVLLKRAQMDGDVKKCPSQCGRSVETQRSLMNHPDVVGIGLIWDSDRPASQHIRDVVQCIGTTLAVSDLFHSISDKRWGSSAKLDLVGVVCYYGKHYSTFFFHSKMHKWISFDDACVKEMGPHWEAVVDKCCRGHYQPLLLLYANPDADPINIDTAPKSTTMLPGHKFYSDDSAGSSSSSAHGRPRSHTDSHTIAGGVQNRNFNFETSLKQNPGPSRPEALLPGQAPIRRTRTPDPDRNLGGSEVSAPPLRRAVTPGPEWGRYQSDDEVEVGGELGAGHFRQPSYLTAMDGCDQPPGRDPYSKASAPPAVQPPAQFAYLNSGVCSTGVPQQNGSYVSQTNGVRQTGGSVDLLGSIPMYQQGQTSAQNSGYYVHPQGRPAVSGSLPQSERTIPNQMYNPPGSTGHYTAGITYPQAVPSGDVNFVNPSVPRSMASSVPSGDVNFVNPSVPRSMASSVAKVKDIQHLQSNHQGYQPGKGVAVSGVLGSQVRSAGVNHGQTVQGKVSVDQVDGGAGPCAPYMHSAPTTPMLKRAKSSELVSQSTVQRPSVGRSRPQSARPFDYGNSRPTVDPKTGAVSISGKTRPENGNPAEALSSVGESLKTNGKWSEDMSSSDEEKNGAYINRRAVESILGKQNYSGKQPRAGVIEATNPSAMPMMSHAPITEAMKAASTHSSNSSLESFIEQSVKHKKAWSHNESLMRDLKVDIPDNVSIGSQRDSGYRSGGSSGDRNSASSTSSTSFDSPTADNFRSFYRPLGHAVNADNLSHSSTESLSSNQSSQSHSTVKSQHKRLSNIPENMMSSSNSSSTTTVDKSVESLSNSRDDLSHPTPVPRSSSSEPRPSSFNAEEEVEKLFLAAEEMMEMSNKKERTGDVHSALVHCNQAIGHFQQALSVQGAPQDTIVRVRMKHNTCVLRSRKLHKDMQRQHSDTSDDLSYNDMDSGSVNSSGSSGSRTQTGATDLINLETDPFKDRINQLFEYQSQNQGQSYYGNRRCSGSNIYNNYQVHGYAQSRPVERSQPESCQIPRSATESSVAKQYQQNGGTDVVKSTVRHNSTGDSNHTDDDDAKSIELYGTLPRRKGRKSEPTPATQPKPSSQSTDVYDAYLQRQKDASFVSGSENPNGLVINHSRQYSREEIKDLLLKDYYTRTNVSTSTGTDQPPAAPEGKQYQQQTHEQPPQQPSLGDPRPQYPLATQQQQQQQHQQQQQVTSRESYPMATQPQQQKPKEPYPTTTQQQWQQQQPHQQQQQQQQQQQPPREQYPLATQQLQQSSQSRQYPLPTQQQQQQQSQQQRPTQSRQYPTEAQQQRFDEPATKYVPAPQQLHQATAVSRQPYAQAGTEPRQLYPSNPPPLEDARQTTNVEQLKQTSAKDETEEQTVVGKLTSEVSKLSKQRLAKWDKPQIPCYTADGPKATPVTYDLPLELPPKQGAGHPVVPPKPAPKPSSSSTTTKPQQHMAATQHILPSKHETIYDHPKRYLAQVQNSWRPDVITPSMHLSISERRQGNFLPGGSRENLDDAGLEAPVPEPKVTITKPKPSITGKLEKMQPQQLPWTKGMVAPVPVPVPTVPISKEAPKKPSSKAPISFSTFGHGETSGTANCYSGAAHSHASASSLGPERTPSLAHYSNSSADAHHPDPAHSTTRRSEAAPSGYSHVHSVSCGLPHHEENDDAVCTCEGTGHDIVTQWERSRSALREHRQGSVDEVLDMRCESPQGPGPGVGQGRYGLQQQQEVEEQEEQQEEEEEEEVCTCHSGQYCDCCDCACTCATEPPVVQSPSLEHSHQCPPPGSAPSSTHASELESQGCKSPPKPALVKRKTRKPRKHRKSVTFSDNVALVDTEKHVPDENDYVAYVTKLMQRTQKPLNSQGSPEADQDIPTSQASNDLPRPASADTDDPDASTSSSPVSDEVTDNSGNILCTLCRKKYITTSEVYCAGCTFYMSRFQPASSSS